MRIVAKLSAGGVMMPEQFQSMDPAAPEDPSETGVPQAEPSENTRILVSGPVLILVEFDRHDPKHAQPSGPKSSTQAEVIPMFTNETTPSSRRDFLAFEDGGLDAFTQETA